MSPQLKHKACKPTPCKAVQPLSMMFGGVACQPWAKTQEVNTQLFSHVGPVSCRHVVSAKLRSMVGLQSAKSTLGVWKALINFAHFDHVFAIPIVFCLPRFAWYTLPMS